MKWCRSCGKIPSKRAEQNLQPRWFSLVWRCTLHIISLRLKLTNFRLSLLTLVLFTAGTNLQELSSNPRCSRHLYLVIKSFKINFIKHKNSFLPIKFNNLPGVYCSLSLWHSTAADIFHTLNLQLDVLLRILLCLQLYLLFINIIYLLSHHPFISTRLLHS